MFCLRVRLNSEVLCTAGVGEYGVLSGIVSLMSLSPGRIEHWRVEGMPQEPKTAFLHVGGLAEDGEDHLHWIAERPISVGDHVHFEIVDLPAADAPVQRVRVEEPFEGRDRKRMERVTRAYARQLGWTLSGPGSEE